MEIPGGYGGVMRGAMTVAIPIMAIGAFTPSIPVHQRVFISQPSPPATRVRNSRKLLSPTFGLSPLVYKFVDSGMKSLAKLN